MGNDDPFSEHSVHNDCSDGNVLVSSYYIYYITPKILFLKSRNTNDIEEVCFLPGIKESTKMPQKQTIDAIPSNVVQHVSSHLQKIYLPELYISVDQVV